MVDIYEIERSNVEVNIRESEIDEIIKFKNVKKLNISKMSKINENIDLCELIFLEELDISDNEIKIDISRLKRLKRLNISNSDIRYYNLNNLINLRYINLSKTNIRELNILKKLKKIKYLNISTCESLLNIEGLKELKKLESLEMIDSNSRLKSINIRNCKKYRYK